jgi:hypothetical protein
VDRTVSFQAVVAIPGQDETLETQPPTHVAPSTPPSTPPRPLPLTGFAPGARLEGEFELEASLGPDALGEWWSAVHPHWGPCRILALGKPQAASAGPRLVIGVRIAMRVPRDPRLELPVGAGGQPRPWVAFQRLESPSLSAALETTETPPVMRWARDLAGGLATLHAYGVPHGGLSVESARTPPRGAARWSRVALGAAGGAPPPESDVHALGAILSALAAAEGEAGRARGLRKLAQRCESEPCPSASEISSSLASLEARSDVPAQRSWLWTLAAGLLGVAVGALGTWLALARSS